jgi:hypothetical protein
MSKPSRTRIVLMLLAVALSFVSLMSQPEPVEAQTCASIGCGGWQYYGCCSANTRTYYRRTCCNGPTCCTQFMCSTNRCMF